MIGKHVYLFDLAVDDIPSGILILMIIKKIINNIPDGII